MMSKRPKLGAGKPKEVPQWKLDMLAAESGETARRPRDDDAVTSAAGGDATAASSSGADDSRGGAPSPRPREAAAAEDDDDDDDVDLSAYDLGGNDDGKDDEPGYNMAPVQLSREELLLRREAEELGRGRRPGKTYFIDDAKASQELSLGGERSKDRKRALEMATRLGIAAVGPGGAIPNTSGNPPAKFRGRDS